jgi:hypothetical protein
LATDSKVSETTNEFPSLRVVKPASVDYRDKLVVGAAQFAILDPPNLLLIVPKMAIGLVASDPNARVATVRELDTRILNHRANVSNHVSGCG